MIADENVTALGFRNDSVALAMATAVMLMVMMMTTTVSRSWKLTELVRAFCVSVAGYNGSSCAVVDVSLIFFIVPFVRSADVP